MYITLIATAIAALFASTSAYTIDPRAATKTCRVTPRCPNEDGCMTTAANGAVFQYKCSTDYNGDIIESSQAGTFNDCAQACSYIKGCTTFNFKDQFCYHIGAVKGTGRPSTSGVTAGVLVKNATVSAPSPSAPSFSCGDVIDCDMDTTKDDRCHYVSPANANATFVARCQMDFYGGDMGLTVTEDLTSCVDECAATVGCMAVSFSTGTCYMKSSIQQNVYSQWVQAAYLLNAH